MNSISELWQSDSLFDWKDALENYWEYVNPKNMKLEKRMDNLKREEIYHYNCEEWYDFLFNQYFRWKYTAANRYATTTKHLRKYKEQNRLNELYEIKEKILDLDTNEISHCLEIVNKIAGLGISGASGLLSLIYPNSFATIDQFVVKALREIAGLREHNEIKKMNPDRLTIRNGILLIELMRGKARDNNTKFGGAFWTQRKIDMILWASRL